MRYLPLHSKTHERNRRVLARAIGPEAIAIIDTADVLRRPGDFEYPFRPDSNFYYLTGVDEPEAVLVLVPGHPNPRMREILFIRETNDFLAQWSGRGLTQDEASLRSGIKTVFWLQELSGTLDRLLSKFQTVYLNAHNSLEAGPLGPSARRASELTRALPLHQLRSALPVIENSRTIKALAEIDQIKRAIGITASGLTRAWQSMRPGLPEYAVGAELSAEFMRLGATASAFSSIVATGKNATIIHFEPGETKIGKDDLVQFDVGAEYGYYAADISRSVPVSGKFTSRQRAVYDAVYRVQQAGIALHKPGATVLEIDEQMRKLILKELVGLGLISKNEAASKDSPRLLHQYYPHISHHLGLDVHDTGSSRLKLEPGMVVTCEPGIYIAAEGIGVRLEDDILITSTGNVVLSADIPSEPDSVERLMQGFLQ